MATAKPLERLVRQVLDLDYGDEQERLRYYELYATAVHVQLIGLPLVGAGVIAIAGHAATGPVLIMLAAAIVPILAGLSHLQRHRVRIDLIASSRRNRGYSIAYAISCLTLVVAVAIRGSNSGFTGGLTVGAPLGVVAGIAAAATARRHRSAERADAES